MQNDVVDVTAKANKGNSIAMSELSKEEILKYHTMDTYLNIRALAAMDQYANQEVTNNLNRIRDFVYSKQQNEIIDFIDSLYPF